MVIQYPVPTCAMLRYLANSGLSALEYSLPKVLIFTITIFGFKPHTCKLLRITGTLAFFYTLFINLLLKFMFIDSWLIVK